MINPSSLDLKALPWLPLEAKSAFPKQAAIYFAIDSLGCVQYIGRSVNVRARWESHHKYDSLSAIGNIRIAYLFVNMQELLPQIEAALIQYFQPHLNVVGITEVDEELKSGIICKLKTLMNKSGINQLQLSKETGLSPATIGRLYKNQAARFDVETLEKICTYFDLENIGELLELKRTD